METKTEKRKISMSELRKYLSDEEISRLDNGDADGYNVSMTSGNIENIEGKPGDYFAERNIIIENRTGIHARLASVFVQTALEFKSKVWLKAQGRTVRARSLRRVIGMVRSGRLFKGTEITIRAEGSDAYDAVTTLIKLVEDKFGEE